MKIPRPDFYLDCSEQLCPVPILMTEEKMEDLSAGQVLEVLFTDPGAEADLEAWCRMSKHAWIACQKEKFSASAYIRKGSA